MRRLATTVLAAVLIVAGFAIDSAPAEADGEEFRVLGEVNRLRSEVGVAPLRRFADLDAVASRQAAAMVEAGTIFHNEDLATFAGGVGALGENVGVGPSADAVQDGFFESPGHRANMLDARFSDLGVDVVHARGFVWVVQVFRESRAPAVTAAATTTTTSPPTSLATTTTMRAVAPPTPAPRSTPPTTILKQRLRLRDHATVTWDERRDVVSVALDGGVLLAFGPGDLEYAPLRGLIESRGR